MDSNLPIGEHIDFSRYWQVVRRHWIPASATFAGVLALSLIAALASKNIYQAEARLLIEPEQTSRRIGIEDGNPEVKKTVLEKDPIETEAEILSSRTIVEKVIQELDLQSEKGEPLTYKTVKKALKVEPVIGTDLLQISYENADPDVAISFVNRAVELYSDGYALFNSEAALKDGDFIKQQLPKLETEVENAEANLRNFKNRNGISDLQGQITADIDSVAQVENQINQVSADLNDVNARYNRLQSQLGMSWQEASAISSLSQSITLQETLAQLQKVKVELAQKSNFLSDSSPQIISLKEEQADLESLLRQEVASTLGPQQQGLAGQINILRLGELKQGQLTEFADLGLRKEGLEQRLASLKNSYNTYQKRSNLSPQLEEQQRQLERKLKSVTENYQTLLSKANEISIRQDYKVDKVRVISAAALAEDPVNPDAKVIVAAGAMMGLLFGTALAFLLDLKDNTIKNTQEVENMFAYPLHGVVPDLSLGGNDQQFQLPGSEKANLPEQIVSEVSMMPLKEAYQNIQVNLNLLDANAKKKVIAITSSVPQEGKSSVSANLAVARSQCGQRILLIDADMRRPTQHHIWEISNQIGLSEVLSGKVSWSETVQNVMPNLDVLTSGSIPNNPIALIDSPSFLNFIAEVAPEYDQVIFDTPPILGIADTRIIGKVVDGFLFVVRPGVADYNSASAAKKMLDSTGLKVLGVIVNGADMKQEPYHYSSHYYAHKK
ncbi:MAG: polysaccharide biosynthesis tyrosine autokinase [Pleurocapsa sp. SU_5_0]|nr:polysaccharide biosynthesis tyrosine autokinase [Pleurocapsa sp. SU_5_0]NJR45215.1 polysaccharide biosynthesis tyrosine autokinase [Hyellaceae cyanobacterium CSU_1_1]